MFIVSLFVLVCFWCRSYIIKHASSSAWNAECSWFGWVNRMTQSLVGLVLYLQSVGEISCKGEHLKLTNLPTFNVSSYSPLKQKLIILVGDALYTKTYFFYILIGSFDTFKKMVFSIFKSFRCLLVNYRLVW